MESSGFSEDGTFNYFRAVSGFQGEPWKALDSQKTGPSITSELFQGSKGDLGKLWILRRRDGTFSYFGAVSGFQEGTLESSGFSAEGNRQLFRSCFGLPRGTSYTVVDYNNIWGAGVVQWLERRTRDRKVAGSNPCWSDGRIFFSRVNFLS